MKKASKIIALLLSLSLLCGTFASNVAFAEDTTQPDSSTNTSTESKPTSSVAPTNTPAEDTTSSSASSAESSSTPSTTSSEDATSSNTPSASDPKTTVNDEFEISGNVLIKYKGTGSKPVVIPEGVASIQTEAFANSSITSVKIPESVIYIYDRAFKGCRSLTSLVIPKGVGQIGEEAFSGCSALTNVVFTEHVGSIGDGTFYQCENLTNVTLPKNMRNIPDGMFAECVNLSKIEITDEVISIGSGAFAGCTKLNNINLPSSLDSIGEATFAGCSSLNKITLPKSITSIGQTAFAGCNELTSIVIPENIENIGIGAFAECSKLTSVTIVNGVQYIAPGAFAQMPALKNVIIPTSVQGIDSAAFHSCPSLSRLTIANPSMQFGNEVFTNTNVLIRSSLNSTSQAYAKANGLRFEQILLHNGQEYSGSVMLDTQSYTMAPRNIYDIGVKLAGTGKQKTIKVYSSRDGIASVKKLPNGNYRITGIKPGTTYITCTVYDGNKELSHASIRITVQNGVKQHGVPARSTSYFEARSNFNQIAPVQPQKIIHNGREYKGSVTLDTQMYTMAPTNIYDVGVKLAGNGNTKYIKVSSSRDGIASVKKLPNGNYRVTGIKPGTTYITCSVYDGTKELTHASIRVTVENGVKQHGVATRSTSYFD